MYEAGVGRLIGQDTELWPQEPEGGKDRVATLTMKCGCDLITHNDGTKGFRLCDTHASLLEDAQMAIQRGKLEGKTIQTVEFDDYYVSYHGCESTTGLLLIFTDETKAYIQAYENDISISEEGKERQNV